MHVFGLEWETAVVGSKSRRRLEFELVLTGEDKRMEMLSKPSHITPN